MTPEETRVRELARLWQRAGEITDHYYRETRRAIVDAAYAGMTPAEIARATKQPKEWVEECILSELTGFPV